MAFDMYRMQTEWSKEQERIRAEEAAAAAAAAATVPAPDDGAAKAAAAGKVSLRKEQSAEYEREKEERTAVPEPEKDPLYGRIPDYQIRAMAMMKNAMALKNVQKVITISNKENIRKGLTKGQPGQKPVQGAQTSTVAIPTALLRRVQQEIGSVRSKLNQNDAMAGFLYWYFGQPDDVVFPDENSAQKAIDVVDSLDANSSPARMGQLSYNVSTALLEKLDVMSERLDGIAAMLGMVKTDATSLKMRADKNHIAICYMLLNYLGMLPLIAPGQTAKDLDMMGGGQTWDIMSSVDTAFDYFRMTDGREKYKAKHGLRPAAASYSPPVAKVVDTYTGVESNPYTGDDDDDYDDVDDLGGFNDMDDFLDDMDDMGDLDDPVYDDDEDAPDKAPAGDMMARKREISRHKAENERVAAAAERSLAKQRAREAARAASGS